MPGLINCQSIVAEVDWDNDKRADVSFPQNPDKDPMDWVSPLGSPELDPLQSAVPVPLENPDDHVNPRFGRVTYLADYPYAPQAEAIMRKVALIVRPVMDEYRWSVIHLTEFYDPKNGDLGLNQDRGECVLLRLRDITDKTKFLQWHEVLSTLLHELCHNWWDSHNGDFCATWMDLNIRFGAAMSDARVYVSKACRPTQHPKGHVSVFFAGTRIFLSEDAYRKHFSIWAQRHQEQDDKMMKSGQPIEGFRSLYIDLSSDHPNLCVIARLLQVARGLDPAINRSVLDVPNAEVDFYTREPKEVAFSEWFLTPEKYESLALDLYLDLFRIGTECGMHDTTKDWLIEHIKHVFHWGPAVDGDDWYKIFQLRPKSFYDGQWTWPTDRQVAGSVLGEMACMIYSEIPLPQGQCLRDIVITRMNELAANSAIAAQYFDLDVLLKELQENEELENDLNASVARSCKD